MMPSVFSELRPPVGRNLRQERPGHELHFFGGVSVEETAEVLGIAPRTIERDWSSARVWLYREVDRGA